MELEDFKYNLSRLKKCDQFWDEMNPILGGRHCNKCDKKIIDFSKMTYTEIAVYMSESNDPVCGFYKPEQLKKSKKRKLQLGYALSMYVFLTNLSFGNTKKNTNLIEINPNEETSKSIQIKNVKTDKTSKTSDSIFISGKIQYFDNRDRQYFPIYGATIIIKGEKRGTIANVDGKFNLHISRANDQDSIYLRIAFLGFKTREIIVKLTEQNKIEIGEILLETDENDLISFYVTAKKRSKLNYFWRKITKPFRKKK